MLEKYFIKNAESLGVIIHDGEINDRYEVERSDSDSWDNVIRDCLYSLLTEDLYEEETEACFFNTNMSVTVELRFQSSVCARLFSLFREGWSYDKYSKTLYKQIDKAEECEAILSFIEWGKSHIPNALTSDEKGRPNDSEKSVCREIILIRLDENCRIC